MPKTDTHRYPVPRLGEVVKERSTYTLGVEGAGVLDLKRADEKLPLKDGLAERLEALPGVSDVAYDGHFGPLLFYTVEVDEDTPELHQRVRDTVSAHLKLAWELGVQYPDRRGYD